MNREIKAIDIEIVTPFESEGVAYYRLPREVREFLQKCEKKHGIAGFEWEVGSWNFGVILDDKKNRVCLNRKCFCHDAEDGNPRHCKYCAPSIYSKNHEGEEDLVNN